MLTRFFLLLTSIVSLNSEAQDMVTGPQLLITSIQQLHQLEKMTTSAQKYTEKAVEASEVAEDRMYLAERFKDWAEDVSELPDSDFDAGLGGVNERVGTIIMSKEDIADIYRELSRDQVILERKVRRRETKDLTDLSLVKSYKRQGLRRTTKTNVILRTVSQNTGAAVVEAAKGNIISKKQLTSLEKAQVYRIKQEKRRLAVIASRKKVWGHKSKGALRGGGW